MYCGCHTTRWRKISVFMAGWSAGRVWFRCACHVLDKTCTNGFYLTFFAVYCIFASSHSTLHRNTTGSFITSTLQLFLIGGEAPPAPRLCVGLCSWRALSRVLCFSAETIPFFPDDVTSTFGPLAGAWALYSSRPQDVLLGVGGRDRRGGHETAQESCVLGMVLVTVAGTGPLGRLSSSFRIVFCSLPTSCWPFLCSSSQHFLHRIYWRRFAAFDGSAEEQRMFGGKNYLARESPPC